MEHLSINTSQNVALNFSIAGVGSRILAGLIDLGIYIGYFMVLFILTDFTGGSLSSTSASVIMMLPITFYHLYMEMIFNGQSIGKMVMQIKVISADGTQAGFVQFLLRWLFRLVDIVLTGTALAIVFVSLNGKGQRLGDLIAGTSVISLKPTKAKNAAFYFRLPANYKPMFKAVALLSETDAQTIFDVLKHCDVNRYTTDTILLATKTKRQIREKMGVETQLESVAFLKQVLRDFNWHISQSEYLQPNVLEI